MNSVLFLIIINYQLLVFITHYHLRSITKKLSAPIIPRADIIILLQELLLILYLIYIYTAKNIFATFSLVVLFIVFISILNKLYCSLLSYYIRIYNWSQR